MSKKLEIPDPELPVMHEIVLCRTRPMTAHERLVHRQKHFHGMEPIPWHVSVQRIVGEAGASSRPKTRATQPTAQTATTLRTLKCPAIVEDHRCGAEGIRKLNGFCRQHAQNHTAADRAIVAAAYREERRKLRR